MESMIEKAENADKYELMSDGIVAEIEDTGQKDAPIHDTRVQQIYTRSDLLPLGCVEQEYDGTTIRIYDKERMLIELLRNKNKMPHDMYKEILYNYRRIIDSLEIWRIQEYAEIFPKSKMIKRAFREEVL